MSAEQLTTSAALYFDCHQDEHRAIPAMWLDRARQLFAEHALSPVLFTASGGDFLYDDCYVLALPGGDIKQWGEVLVARGPELVDSLQNGGIEYLGLDSPRVGGVTRENWRAAISVSLALGEIYVGIDEERVPDPSSLLRQAYDLAKDLFDIRYGIAYKSPLAHKPDCYASGVVSHSVSEVFDMIRHRDQWSHRQKSPVELWGDELDRQQRHLTGLFRGAYRASVLTEAHLRTAALTSCGIGTLLKLDASHWLWELSEFEMPTAEAILEARHALVSQAHDS